MQHVSQLQRKGFINNNLADLDTYTVDQELDGFVIEGRAHLLRSSERYRAYQKDGCR